METTGDKRTGSGYERSEGGATDRAPVEAALSKEP